MKDKNLKQNLFKEKSEKRKNEKNEWKKKKNQSSIFRLYLLNQARNLGYVLF